MFCLREHRRNVKLGTNLFTFVPFSMNEMMSMLNNQNVLPLENNRFFFWLQNVPYLQEQKCSWKQRTNCSFWKGTISPLYSEQIGQCKKEQFDHSIDNKTFYLLHSKMGLENNSQIVPFHRWQNILLLWSKVGLDHKIQIVLSIKEH